eukprot:scaffold4189_cov378-Prasinococcus_capsulatus_cf.AAC.3
MARLPLIIRVLLGQVALMAARGETPVKMRKDVAYKNKLAKGSSQPVEEVVGTGKLVKRGGKVSPRWPPACPGSGVMYALRTCRSFSLTTRARPERSN